MTSRFDVMFSCKWSRETGARPSFSQVTSLRSHSCQSEAPVQGRGLGSEWDLVGRGLNLGVGLFDQDGWWEMKNSRCRCDQTNQSVRSIITARENQISSSSSLSRRCCSSPLFCLPFTHPWLILPFLMLMLQCWERHRGELWKTLQLSN